MDDLHEQISACRACARLVQWREHIGVEKRRAFRDEEYWARPVPGFGDSAARLLVLGLAPAAHGANRTGRVFTGDRSGDWLFAGLYRTGFANQPGSTHIGDGLTLSDVYITAAVKCAPPDNRPLPEERDLCRPFLLAEISQLTQLRAILCLGAFAWDQAFRLAALLGHDYSNAKPRFGHGAEADAGPLRLFGSYHPSQQNTFTGRLTEPMFDAVLIRARAYLGEPLCTSDSGGR
jgi:uracil-DNA glycosylase family 4